MTLLESVILDLLESEQPENVEKLVHLVQNQVDASLDEIKAEIKKLHKKGLVSLDEPTHSKLTFMQFVSAKENYWFWISLTVSVLSFVGIIFSCHVPEFHQSFHNSQLPRKSSSNHDQNHVLPVRRIFLSVPQLSNITLFLFLKSHGQ